MKLVFQPQKEQNTFRAPKRGFFMNIDDSNFKPSIAYKTKHEEFEVYKTAISVMLNENNTVHQSGNYFLISNTILVAAIAQLLFNEGPQVDHQRIFLAQIMSLVGVINCLLWLGTFLRRFTYYEFRVAQTRQREPKGLSLIADDGKEFSKGTSIHIKKDNRDYHLNWFHRKSHTKNVIIVLIITFFVLYSISLIISFSSVNQLTPTTPIL